MKTRIAFAALVIIVSLAGCGNPREANAPKSPQPSAQASTEAQPAQERFFEIPPDEMPVQFNQPSGQTLLKESTALIHVPEARAAFLVSGAGLAAAILDTGLRATHVDFHGRVLAQHNWTPDNGGAVDNAADGQGHGTNVAGIVGSREDPATPGAPNGEHTGVAPGAVIIPLKVLANNGKGNFSWVESALTWVLQNRQQHQISVVNMSLGDGSNPTADDAFGNDKIRSLVAQLRNERVAVVVAAGNDYFKHKTQGMAYPAIFRETVSVGAVYDADIGSMQYLSGATANSTAANRITPFSQRLHDSVANLTRTDIFAPGAAVTSSGISNDRGESVQQGTSQAAPMTAGVILLMQEYHLRVKHQLPTVDDIEKWLREGAVTTRDDCNNCDNVPHTKLSFPRVDALGALNAVKKAIEP